MLSHHPHQRRASRERGVEGVYRVGANGLSLWRRYWKYVCQPAPSVPTFVRAQTPHLPRGTATDVTNDDIQATVKKTASAAVSDQAIRVVGIKEEYNVGIGVVHRAKTTSRSAGNGVEHSQITETEADMANDQRHGERLTVTVPSNLIGTLQRVLRVT